MQLMVRLVARFSYMPAQGFGYGAPAMAYGYGVGAFSPVDRAIKHTLHQQSLDINPKDAERVQDKRLQIPFTFILPQDLPPSCTLLASGAFSNPFGVQYFVETFLHPKNPTQTIGQEEQTANGCALKFVKTHLFVENRDVSPVVVGQKAGSSSPVKVTATLVKGIVEVGQPISVDLDIDNQGAKEIKSIVAHLKQTVVINMGSSTNAFGGKSCQSTKSMVTSKEFHETVAASTKKNIKVTVLPQLDLSEANANVAFTRLSSNDNPDLCASYSPVPGTIPSITIAYYINIKLKIAGGSDLKVKIPVEISSSMPLPETVVAQAARTITAEDKEEWFGQLVEMGFPMEHVKLGLENVKHGSIVEVIDWIGKNAQKMANAAEQMRSAYVHKNNAHVREESVGKPRPGSLVVVVDNESEFI
eukprot:Nk52_evm15s307 gene=Nk52_evmTU15s307